MLGPHALRWLVLAGASLLAAFAWQRHGVAAERADRLDAIEQRLRTARLHAADDLARSFLEDFGADARVQRLADDASAALRAQELLERRDPASARALLEPRTKEPDAPAVIWLLFGRACQQLGDRAAADAALRRFRELAPDGFDGASGEPGS